MSAAEQQHQCIGRVWSPGAMHSHRCRNNAAHEHLGEWYCKAHHPPTRNEKREARAEERRKEAAARYERWEQEAAQQAAQKAEQKRRADLYPELLECLLDVLDADGDLDVMDFNRYRAAIAKATGEDEACE